MSVFVIRLKELKASNKVSSFALAEHIGVTSDRMMIYENGIAEPNFDEITKIASVFGVSVDYLLGSSNSPKPVFDITGEEKDIIIKYRAMSRKDKKIFSDIIFDLFNK